MVPARLFGLFCVASYLLSLSYGSTFLLSLLIGSRGGNEHDASSVISVAMLSTLVAVIFSGHLSDLLGAARSIALFGCLLVVASLGFALAPGFGDALLFFGLTLGLGKEVLDNYRGERVVASTLAMLQERGLIKEGHVTLNPEGEHALNLPIKLTTSGVEAARKLDA